MTALDRAKAILADDLTHYCSAEYRRVIAALCEEIESHYRKPAKSGPDSVVCEGRAKEAADRIKKLSYPEDMQDSPAAMALWFRAYNHEYQMLMGY